MEKSSLKIKGMTCAACAAKIEKSLSKMAGVTNVNVNLAMEKAAIEYDSTKIKLIDFVEKINKLGYQVVADNVDLKIQGMTCAACAAKIEKKLNLLPGVARATVNLATEKASVTYYSSVVSTVDLKAVIEKLGYKAQVAGDRVDSDKEKESREKEIRKQKMYFIFSAVLSLPLALFMFAELFKWTWVPDIIFNMLFQLALATPIQFIAGAQFYKDAYYALKNKSANMAVLVA